MLRIGTTVCCRFSMGRASSPTFLKFGESSCPKLLFPSSRLSLH
ncbi:hypothetical protein SynROS8604_01225 [Synechococcus sp. ROS8604]|nr:hypothetical protein SynROS8604_01225 [Synechococcus sp. ROS8604]